MGVFGCATLTLKEEGREWERGGVCDLQRKTSESPSYYFCKRLWQRPPPPVTQDSCILLTYSAASYVFFVCPALIQVVTIEDRLKKPTTLVCTCSVAGRVSKFAQRSQQTSWKRPGDENMMANLLMFLTAAFLISYGSVHSAAAKNRVSLLFSSGWIMY
jgi:hypothetical protein